RLPLLSEGWVGAHEALTMERRLRLPRARAEVTSRCPEPRRSVTLASPPAVDLTRTGGREPRRRGYLAVVSCTANGLTASALAIPLVGFILTSLGRRATRVGRDLGAVGGNG